MVIVAVEGPSAAGKTTWCRSTGRDFVDEYKPTGLEPEALDTDHQATYWTDVNSERWAEALALEAKAGLALCDSDPLKLHYSWCLARLGEAPVSRFAAELSSARDAMRKQQLGFSDAVLLTMPNTQTLHRQKAGDRSRSRRSFDLHVRLREPLVEWYQCLDQLGAGHVFWQLPDTGPTGELGSLVRRPDRYNIGLLDALVNLLPALDNAQKVRFNALGMTH
jgi:hypothetical protein